jgi:PKD repeat protein
MLMAQPAGTPLIHPEDPFQFIVDGETWYPAGYYPALGAITLRWGGDPLVDYYEALLDTLSDNGINYTRLQFTMGVAPDWGTCVQSCPYDVVGTVNKSGNIFGKVDLDTFDQDHFDLWYDLIQYAGNKGITIQLAITDSWHILANEPPWWHINHDFYASGMNDDGLAINSADDWHTTNTSAAVWARHVDMVEKVVDELGGLPNIVWEVSNEPRFYYDNNNYSDIITKETAPTTDWAVKLGNHLKSYEYSTRSYNHVCMPNDLHDHQKTPGQRNKWRVGYTDCMTPTGTRRDFLYILGLTDSRFPDRPMFSDNDGGGDQALTDRRKKAWACLTGRAHMDYFHFDIREHDDLTSTDATDGMTYVGNPAKLVNTYVVELAGMVPADSLVTSGWCLARSGDEYIIFLPSGGSTTVSNLPTNYDANWFNPRGGGYFAATGGPSFTAPNTNDWALHIVATWGDDISVDFGNTDVEDGVARKVPEAGNANTEGTTIGGRQCRKNVDTGDRHFFMLINDSWAFAGSKTAVDITVEYYDTGTDGIKLIYDGTGGATDAGTVNFTNTNTWKSKTWNLTDAYLASRIGSGYDFRITAKTLGTIFYLDTITVDEGTGQSPPVADIDATPTSGTEPLQVSFDASGSSDSDGSIVSYEWDFDNDGTVDATGVTTTHTYQTADTYTCKLTVTDNDSLTDDDTVNIQVNSSVDSVSVDFGNTDVEDGLERKEPEASNANTEGTTIGGRNCRKNVDTGDRHFYMLVDDNWAYQGDKSYVDITIEYYDTGTDGLNLVYDATSGDSLAGTINFTNTNTWKSYEFNIYDAYFGNRSGTGYDFRLTAKTAGTIFYVDTVEIVEGTAPASVDVDFGNTDVENNLERKEPEAGNANTEGTTIGGRECRKNVDSGDRHFFMLVDDSWAYQGNKTTVDVTVDYYDTGTDGLTLVYDSTTGDANAGTVDFTNTDTWKTKVWSLTDAYFGNRSGSGYDFRLTAKTLGTIFYLDTVEVAE